MVDKPGSKPLSILHIVLSTETGGMENVIYNLASACDSSRLRISVVCLLELGLVSDKLRDVGVQSTKLVYTEHGRRFPDSRFQMILDRIAVRFTSKVIAVGESLRDYLVSAVKLPQAKVVMIRNGVDTERFKPSDERGPARRESGYTDENIVIGIVARLAPIKNHRLLIDAFRVVAGTHSEARLLIIGSGALREMLERMVSEYGLRDKITFVPDRPDIPRLLTGIDISVLSSLCEGTSLTLLEAMSTGLPVVATAVGGNPAIIASGDNGFLVESNNPDAFAQQLIELVRSPELRRRIGKRARDQIVAEWSLKAMVDAYERLYCRLAGSH